MPVLEEIVRNRALVVPVRAADDVGGLAVVLTHNVWVASWPVLITIVGWLTADFRRTFACSPRKMPSSSAARLRATERHFTGAAIWVVIGAVLCFFGYLQITNPQGRNP